MCRRFNILKFLKMPFYAVKSGRKPGLYKTWDECNLQVKGFPNAKFKKFSSENEALNFIHGDNVSNCVSSLKRKASSDNVEAESTLFKKNVVTVNANETVNIHIPPGHSGSITGKQSFYAVHRGIKPGVYRTWTECEVQIKSFKNPCYRKLTTEEEALEFVRTGGIRKVTKSQAKRLETIPDFANEDISNVCPDDLKFDPEKTYTVFTDGASSKNGTKLAAAGIGVYWGPNHPLNVSERLPGRQTNNRAEIYAAIYALRQAKQYGVHKLKLYTDSQFLIRGITDWINKWKKNGWILSNGEPVKNKDDFIELDKAREGVDVEFIYIKAHANLPGNTEADKLAVKGAQCDKADAFVILT